MTGIRFRTATADDWPAIWPVWHRVVAAGGTYVWDPDTGSDDARRLWMVPPPGAVFVAETEDSGIVATAQLKPVQPGAGDHVANAGFMVDPDAAGGGIGRRLAEHVLDEARRRGFRGMQFNAVVETNERAVALWRSLGFDVVGTVPRAFRHPTAGEVGLHVMYRDV
ncbi:MAG: GNAT family N-acetyltransferase [Pseudonocardia sp. SCN 72-86]|nr:MAG: GNAT family N-acetyltransferase [Pseudonocardia sp. SCN 72-86]